MRLWYLSQSSDEPARPRKNRQRLNCPRTHRRNVDEGACLNFG